MVVEIFAFYWILVNKFAKKGSKTPVWAVSRSWREIFQNFFRQLIEDGNTHLLFPYSRGAKMHQFRVISDFLVFWDPFLFTNGSPFSSDHVRGAVAPRG